MSRLSALRPAARRLPTSLPPTSILPASGFSKPTSILAKVVLPQPDSPTMPSDSPRCTVRVTSSTALTRTRLRPARPARKVLLRLVACRTTSAFDTNDLLCAQASGRAISGHGDQLGAGDMALVECPRAPGVERASGGQRRRHRRAPWDDGQL